MTKWHYLAVACGAIMLGPGGARAEAGVWSVAVLPAFAVAEPGPLQQSARLERAKDLIADEQWLRAITELRAAAADPKEANKDEALFWLAHSQNQAHQFVAALETVGRLEKGHPKSRWIRPAQSLRLEIAQRLGRTDVLWLTARPTPAPPAPPAPAAPAPPHAPAPAVTPPAAVPAPAPPPPAVPPAAPPARPAPAPQPPPPPRTVPVPPGASYWFTNSLAADPDLRIQALGTLIHMDADKAIPWLKEIALDVENPGAARRALFVLAQSGRPEARTTVIEVARTGPEPVQIAAIRELGRLPDASVQKELLEVYTAARPAVRYHVVSALGEQAATTALLRIAQQEGNAQLREVAITTLGSAGGREQLSVLYTRATPDTKRYVITGFFNAGADEELIRIVRTERDLALRKEAVAKLRLLGTPRAQEFLATVDRR